MKRSKGFTLVELLVVVGIIALLVTILMPTLGRAMELARRSICGANLNTIGKGMHIYLAEHEAFPLLFDGGPVDAVLDDTTHHDELWTTAGQNALRTNAMQNVWLLIKYGTSEKAFQCPSDGDYQERSKSGVNDLKDYGWVDRKNFSYGLHKPYDDVIDSGENKAPLTQTPQGNFVIMADKNDGSQGPGRIYWANPNSLNKPSNHKDDGFNCLTYQGSVKFHKAKMGTNQANSKAGVNDDDIYSVEGVNTIPIGADEDPKKDYDTFIVPWKG